MPPPSTTDFSRGFHPSLVLTSRATCLTPSGQGPRPQDQQSQACKLANTRLTLGLPACLDANPPTPPSLTLPSPSRAWAPVRTRTPPPHFLARCSAAASLQAQPSLSRFTSSSLQNPVSSTTNHLDQTRLDLRVPPAPSFAYQRPASPPSPPPPPPPPGPSPPIPKFPPPTLLSVVTNKGIFPATVPSHLLFDGCPGAPPYLPISLPNRPDTYALDPAYLRLRRAR